MARHHFLRHRSIGLALVVALAASAAACGGDDESDSVSDVESAVSEAAEELEEQAGEPDADTDPDIDAPAATGTVAVTGAVEDTLAEADDGVAFRAGGGCFEGAFSMSVKVDVDGRTRYDVIVEELEGVDETTTGEFVTPVEFHYIDPDAEGMNPEVFSGDGTVTIVDQDPDARAFAYTVEGSMVSEEDESRTVDVDFAYTAPIICG